MDVLMEQVREAAVYRGLRVQRVGESNDAYRHFVAGELRAAGHVIEAAELAMGRRFEGDDGGFDSTVIAAAAGAMLPALGRAEPHPRHRQHDYTSFGDDLARGMIALSDPDPAGQAMARAFDLLGPAAFDLFGGGSR